MASSRLVPAWQRHEFLLTALGLLTTSALLLRSGPTSWATLWTATATVAYGLLVGASSRRTELWVQKCRFAASFVYIVWFYNAIEFIVPALGQPLHDQALLEIDQRLFGVTPSVSAQSIASVGLSELMSGCYLCYLVYLHGCVIHSWLMPLEFNRRFANWIYSVYAIGLAGYMLYPAVGPINAFGELFSVELRGPFLTPLNRWIVQAGSSVYDAFPSLHVLITLALIDFDRRNLPTRFYWMVLPVIGIAASTIYLRYHYAIDLIAAVMLFIVAKLLFKEGKTTNVETGNREQ